MPTQLESLYTEHFHCPPQEIAPIAGQGSNRRYYRLSSTECSVVGTIGEDVNENNVFFSLSTHLRHKGINVPEVLSVSSDRKCYLQTDLGDTSLFDIINSAKNNNDTSQSRVPGNIDRLLSDTIAMLPRLQWEGGNGFDFSRCFPVSDFDQNSIDWDLNYFKYCFLKTAGISFSEPALQRDFDEMRNTLLAQSCTPTLMYRDFQSRNVMIHDGKPWFIDFQGARRGPIHYDLASFLWQARAGFTPSLRHRLIDIYIEASQPYVALSHDIFKSQLLQFVLFRQLQTLGAYGFRGLIEHKSHFIKSILPALNEIHILLQSNPALATQYPSIAHVTEQALQTYTRIIPPAKTDRLTITIGSFSYMKGLPEDYSGNGGGFVFDCRGMHNPGRYQQYKLLTGRDKPVIDFLEERGEVQQFVDNALALVEGSIDTYIRRGFTSLNIWMGCTGGQHRSVYCADRIARLISERYHQVDIRLIHREQPQLTAL